MTDPMSSDDVPGRFTTEMSELYRPAGTAKQGTDTRLGCKFMGTKAKNASFLDGVILAAAQNPPPGKYNIVKDTADGITGGRMSKAKTGDSGRKRPEEPGPGAYNFAVGNGFQCGYQINKSCPKVKGGCWSKKPRKCRADFARPRDAPAPCKYNVTTEFAKPMINRPNAAYTNGSSAKQGKAWGDGKEVKSTKPKINAPGPGHYTINYSQVLERDPAVKYSSAVDKTLIEIIQSANAWKQGPGKYIGCDYKATNARSAQQNQANAAGVNIKNSKYDQLSRGRQGRF